MKHLRVCAIILLAACSTATVTTAPQPSDDLDIKATVLATYNVISGPAGRRDWDRFKELFVPGARILHVGPDGSAMVATPDDFETIAKPMFDQAGVFAHPVSTQVQRNGNLATVLSAFESRHASTDAAPFEKGVDAFELLRVKDQWKIVSITRTMAQ
jgi:hypothetical protein